MCQRPTNGDFGFGVAFALFRARFFVRRLRTDNTGNRFRPVLLLGSGNVINNSAHGLLPGDGRESIIPPRHGAENTAFFL